MSTATAISDMKQIKDHLHNSLMSTSLSKLIILAIEGPPLAKLIELLEAELLFIII